MGAGDGLGVGAGVGLTEGTGLGEGVGLADGVREGSAVGLAEGEGVGLRLGNGDGAALGSGDGLAVGASVGFEEGASVGTAVGDTVGLGVGTVVGLGVGEDVHAAVLQVSCCVVSGHGKPVPSCWVLTDRLRTETPPAHSCEQAVHALHPVTAQSTGHVFVLQALASAVYGQAAPLPACGVVTARVLVDVPPSQVAEQAAQFDQPAATHATAMIVGS